ncbi:MAG: ABC transporter permease [Bacteroidales bacterium]|nr:ABC transporter permease [Bacteroidales bacterium]
MNLYNLFKIALRALNANKFRGFLTMLGIIIGVASVITMLAIGQGSKQSIRNQISQMGSNMLMIHPGSMRMGGVRQDASSMQSLKMADFNAIKEKAENVLYLSPSVSSSSQAVYGANNTPTTLYGVNSEYLDIRKYKVQEGDLFSEADIKSFAKVCLIGKTVIDNLFTNGENPLGKYIRFGKTPFKIIGILESKGYNSMGMDQDDLLIAPYTTVQKRVLAINYLQGIYASATDEESSPAAVEEIENIIRFNHNIKEGAEDDFEVRSQEEMSSMMTSTTDLMTILLSCIAGISLLVGGIGIMNIMYVSVTERTREIGLRMSIGAKGIDILMQFLIEAVLLSFAGGIIGVIFGVTTSVLVKVIAGWPILIQPWSVFLSFAVCTVTGVFFGWYPAKKAAGLDPIEAIRYE